MKSYLMTALVIIGLLQVPISVYSASTDFSVYVDSKSVAFTDAKPFISDSARTMIPLRAVSEAMGADVIWQQSNQTAVVTLKGIVISFGLGKDYAIVDGYKMPVDAKTLLKEGRVYIPLRFVSENLNYNVYYRYADDTKTSVIEKVHIIEIKSRPGTLVERGFGSKMPQEDMDHPERFFSLLTDPKNQIQMIGDSIHYDQIISANGFEPDISVWYSKKGLITLSLEQLPPSWDYFLRQSLKYMIGTDGSKIADQLIALINGTKTDSGYALNKIVGKTFVIGNFKTIIKASDTVQITFVEK